METSPLRERSLSHPGRSDEENSYFVAATYNVHRWVGLDGLYDPSRISRVIRELRADVLGLQEVVISRNDKPLGIRQDELARETGMKVILGPTLHRENDNFGNVLLTSHPVVDVRRLDLSVRDREPRGALDVDLDIGGVTVRVIVTHLGLRTLERHHQVKRLLEAFSSGATERVIMMGDFNEWLPPSLLLWKIHKWFGNQPSPRTYPSALPMLPLDRIWVRPRQSLVRLDTYKTSLSRKASDHLPLRATVQTRGEVPEGADMETSGCAI